MKEDTLALTKAVDSGDTDLGMCAHFSPSNRESHSPDDLPHILTHEVYHVLLHLQRQLSLGDFFRLLEDGGPRLAQATNLLQVYAREQNRELLRDYYFQDDRRVDSACLALDDAARAQVSVVHHLPFAAQTHFLAADE